MWKRITPSFIELLKELLVHTIQKASLQDVDKKLFGMYNRVLLQDSSGLHLPDWMHMHWKGNVSRGVQKSVAKINVVLDLLSSQFAHCSLESYSNPEQSLGSVINSIARKGDLVIRDMGYFAISQFLELMMEKVHFISRLRYGVNLYDPVSGEKLDIPTLLADQDVVDIPVILGEKKKCNARLVAIKLSLEKVEQRVQKAKRNRDRRCNHSKEYYHLLRYIIFITNVPKKQWNHHQVAQAYRTRWNIEILFKCWKSNFKIEQHIPKYAKRKSSIEAIIYLNILLVSWFQNIYSRWIIGKVSHTVSVRKVAAFIMSNISIIINFSISDNQLKSLLHHCRHETRAKKSNATVLIHELFLF